MRSLPVFLLLLLASPVLAGPDPADLFPADTLLYVELNKPGPLALEVKSLLKGSVLEDIVPYIQKLREEAGPEGFFEFMEIGMIGTLFGPEAIAEFQRLQGFAFGVTGFNAKHEPELAAVLLCGESNLPGFVMRGFLSSSPEIRKVGEVEGVLIYQEDPQFFENIQPNGNPANGPMPKKREPMTGVPTYAYFPGTIVLGSSVDAVGDVIRRIRGKEKRLSLAGAPGFQEMKTTRQQPGFLFYTEFPTLVTKIDAMNKASGVDVEPYEWELLKKIVNPKAVRSVIGSLSLNQGNMDCRFQVHLNGKERSPLFDMLVGKKVTVDQLARAPKETWLALTLSLPAEKRWEKLLALADAFAEASGELGRMPSEAAQELEDRLQLKVARTVIDRIEGLTVVMPGLTKSIDLRPVVVLHTDATIAETLDGILPTLLGMLSDGKVDPVIETINGQRIRSFPVKGPWGTALHVGRRDGLMFFGADRKLVAVAMTADVKQSILSHPKIATALQSTEDSSLIGVWQWGALLAQMLKNEVKEQPAEGPPMIESNAKILKDLTKFAESLPPMVVFFGRQNDVFRLEVRQREVNGIAPKLVDLWVDAYRRSISGAEQLQFDR